MSDNLYLQVGSLGLHCLRKSTSGMSLIFAHGLLSDGEGAWGRPQWPQLLVDDEDLKTYSVYVFSYRTSLASGTYSIGDASRILKAYFDLENLWLEDRIVFVGHSMGGIVFRKFITTNQMRVVSEKIDAGLFLIASPSLGAKAATTLTELSWIFGHTQALDLRFSRTNTWLNDLDTEFTTLKESGSLSLVGKELVEDKALPVVRWFGLRSQLVEPFSAAKYFGEPLKIPDSDHISIAKPGSRDALQYRLLKRFLTEFPRRGISPLFPTYDDDTAGARQAIEGLRHKLPAIENWGDAIAVIQEALAETRAYVVGRREGRNRDADVEDRLSRVWSDAGTALFPYDRELAQLCYVKGQGWADPKLWGDSRFADLPTELNDLTALLMEKMASRASQENGRKVGGSAIQINSSQSGSNNKNAQIAGQNNIVKM